MNLAQRFATAGILICTLPLTTCHKPTPEPQQTAAGDTNIQQPAFEATLIEYKREIGACLNDGAKFQITMIMPVAVWATDAHNPVKSQKFNTALEDFGNKLDLIFRSVLRHKNIDQASNVKSWSHEVEGLMITAHQQLTEQIRTIATEDRYKIEPLDLGDMIVIRNSRSCSRSTEEFLSNDQRPFVI